MSAVVLNSFIKFPRTLSCINSRLFSKSDLFTFDHSLKNTFPRCNHSQSSPVSWEDSKVKLNNTNLDPYVCFKLLRLIKGAIREQGSILEENEKLVSLLKRAEELKMPFDFIDYIQRIVLDNRRRSGILEMLYLNHGLFVIQYEDIDICDTKHHLLQICEKYDAYLTSGKMKWNQHFNLKGFLSVQNQKTMPITNESEAKKVASKTGVVFAKKELEIGNWISWQFHCEPGNLHKYKKKLEEQNYAVEEAYVGLVPKRKIPLPPPTRRLTHSIISAINKIPVIDNVYHNIML